MRFRDLLFILEGYRIIFFYFFFDYLLLNDYVYNIRYEIFFIIE